MRRIFDWILVLSLLLAPASPSFAQTFGQITGQVTDASGGILVGASVTVTNTQTNAGARGPDEHVRQLRVPHPAPGHLQRQSGLAGLSEQSPQRS